MVVRQLITIAVFPYMSDREPYSNIAANPNAMNRTVPSFKNIDRERSIFVSAPVIFRYLSKYLEPQHKPKPIKELPIDNN